MSLPAICPECDGIGSIPRYCTTHPNGGCPCSLDPMRCGRCHGSGNQQCEFCADGDAVQEHDGLGLCMDCYRSALEQIRANVGPLQARQESTERLHLHESAYLPR